jgi:hypothetical protein
MSVIDDVEKLLRLEILDEISDHENLSPGKVLRRICGGKDQQGLYTGMDDSSGLIVVNVVDMAAPSFLAEAGVIRPSEKDRLFRYTTTFRESGKAREAMEILRSWPLYIKNPAIQAPMEYFFSSSFTPEHILHLRNEEMLDAVFIPLQQKLKIGRYVESVNWDLVRKKRFSDQLDGMKAGDHITYLALIPQTSSYAPKFYSIGTKPHEEIQHSLRAEAFNFKPTHGGHIKAVKSEKGMVYHVDAGSNFIGKGIKTRLETAEAVVKALRREYGGHVFIPIEGRGAFGSDQSY